MSNRELTECELNAVAAGHYPSDIAARAIPPAPRSDPPPGFPTDPWRWLPKFLS
jgi:hypothetical protein